MRQLSRLRNLNFLLFPLDGDTHFLKGRVTILNSVVVLFLWLLFLGRLDTALYSTALDLSVYGFSYEAN